jgi:hypothetical protein
MRGFVRIMVGLALTLAGLFAVAAPAMASVPYSGTGHWHDPAFSKGGVSLNLNATCPTATTVLSKISSSGGNPGYAPRIQGKSSTWFQGPEVSSGTTQIKLQATQAPAKNHGVRVFWASGAQNYTFSC